MSSVDSGRVCIPVPARPGKYVASATFEVMGPDHIMVDSPALVRVAPDAPAPVPPGKTRMLIGDHEFIFSTFWLVFVAIVFITINLLPRRPRPKTMHEILAEAQREDAEDFE